MAYYVQRKERGPRRLETVGEFETRREAIKMAREYRMADPSADYYVSQRACKDWHDDDSD